MDLRQLLLKVETFEADLLKVLESEKIQADAEKQKEKEKERLLDDARLQCLVRR